MTRPIKFRAWDSTRKELKDRMSPPMTLTEWAIDATKNGKQFDGFEGEIEKFYGKLIFMQFTGLLDKNGKEIYEGDLIGYWHKAFWVVGWSEEKGKYMFQYPGGSDDIITPSGESLKGKDGFVVSKSVCSKKEIIGNIYENSELLK